MLAVAFTPCAAARAADAPVLPGVVLRVADGDSVDVRLQSGVIRVRLHAVDAPEHDQPHGTASRRALARLALRKSVGVEPFEQDRYDRMVARLWIDGLDVNAELLKLGAAWVYRRYADDAAYCAEEQAARDHGRGLWALPREQRIAPWEWRQRQRTNRPVASPMEPSLAECTAGLRR